LLEILGNDDIDDDEFDSEILKINTLLFNIASGGNVFKENHNQTLMSMIQNDSRIVWTNDRSGDKECVYIICVSSKKRRVTVIFRGTSTINDIMKNADFSILTQENPIRDDYPGKTDSIEWNNGYAGYLYDERDDTGRTKFDEVADRAYEYGEELGEGGFSLYVTGHSMGGALAAMFGFNASLDRRFAQKGNPVRLFTFAAAIPGRISFAKAFQYQEKVGLIQHLRITNDNDIVPLAHPQSETTFAHTGISLILHEDKNKLPSIKYVNDLNWWGTWKANIQTNLFLNFPWAKLATVGRNHGTVNHVKRIQLAKEKIRDQCLDKVTLNDLYATYVPSSPKLL